MEVRIIKKKERVKPKDFTVYSLSDGGTPSTTRNKQMIEKCDFYLPSTCFGEDKMITKDSFYDLPQNRGYGIVATKEVVEKAKQIQWNEVAFRSTNGAYNLRQSLIIEALLQGVK